MNVTSKPANRNAAGQYLGYSEQEARFCYHLLDSPDGSDVIMEGEDDVAIRLSDGSRNLEQVKSATAHNALSDWSIDLWKTVGDWVSDFQSGVINLKTTQFRLYVTPVQSGEIAEALHSANDAKTAKVLCALIHEKRNALPRKPRCNKHVQSLLDLDEEQFLEFVSRVSVESVHARPEHSVEALWGPTYSDETKQRLTHYAIGLARDKANALIKSSEEGAMKAGDFRKEIQLFAARLNLPTFLISTLSDPPADTVTSAHSQRPVFVRQLEIIDIGREQEMRAVADFLRASADKTKWAEEGDIAQSDLDDWDSTLVRGYNLNRGEIRDLYSDKPAETQGRIVLRLCLKSKVKLAGQEVPNHFTPGSFHQLSDKMQVGWHPDYEVILEGDP